MFDPPIISVEAGDGRLDLRGLPILVDSNDYQGIQKAVANLCSDLERVTGCRPAVLTTTDTQSVNNGVILVGSLDRSKYLRDLAEDGTNRIPQLQDKWESFHTSLQECPWAVAQRMLVIAGSDQRGAIFGVYTLSEQIGVSPWYWWADVPIQKRLHIYALTDSTLQGEPSVQYRGLFINDESPALSDWVHEKVGPVFGSKFYEMFFELLLRMKANFFWPAMWSGFPEPGSSFFADDPDNQKIADACGIVVSTSHHEPMQRSTTEWRRGGEGPWNWSKNKNNISEFFVRGAERSRPYESIFTLGMRGEGDGSIESDDPKSTLTDVIATQRRIIQDVYGKPDGVGQVMALYKEVQEYYENGLEIPEDVTLLFADDNFGNIRRLPTKEEQKRLGGSGIYYHLEYVGHPRSYKWLNTNCCGKLQQQLRLAHDNKASKIWIFNVGDIKPLEMPVTFALSLAWNINCMGPTDIGHFFHAYAAREFGWEHIETIASLLEGQERLRALRRHEHIEPSTFSILNYREAETILEKYFALEDLAASLFDTIEDSYKAAFFQLVLHPIKASRIYTEVRITQNKNRLYGLQRRNTTNLLAHRAISLFEQDWSLSEEYHDNAWSGNKWQHIMEQPRYGFSPDTWHAPSRDLLTGLCFVQSRQKSNNITGQMGVAVEGHPGVRPGLINEESDRMQPSRGELIPGLTLPPLSPYGEQNRYFDIYTRGTAVVKWTILATKSWAMISQSQGLLSPDAEADQRIEITIDWKQVPLNFEDLLHLDIRSTDGCYEQVHIPIVNRHTPPDFGGFVESDGYVAIEPAAVPLSDTQQQAYQIYPYLGRVTSGAVGLSTAVTPSFDRPWLEYPVFIFSTLPTVEVCLYFTMALDTSPNNQLCYDFSLGDNKLTSVPLLETLEKGDLPLGWDSAVQDGVWLRKHSFPHIEQGSHCLRYRPSDSRVQLERIVVDLGGVRESYLGPPTSSFVVAQ